MVFQINKKIDLINNAGFRAKNERTFLMELVVNQPHLFPTVLKTLDTLPPDEIFKLLTQTTSFGYTVFMYAARYQPTVLKVLIKTMGVFTKDQQLFILRHTDCCQQNLLGLATGYQPNLLDDLLNLLEKFDTSEQENIIQQKSICGYQPLHVATFLSPQNLSMLLKRIQYFGIDKVKAILHDKKNMLGLNVLEMAAKEYPKKGITEFFSEMFRLPFEDQLCLFRYSSPKKMIDRYYRFKHLPEEAPILVGELKFQLTFLQRKLADIEKKDSKKSSYQQPLQNLIDDMLDDKKDWKTKKTLWDKTIKTLSPQIIKESTLHRILSLIGNLLLCLVVIGIPKILFDMHNKNQRYGFFKPTISKVIDDSNDTLVTLSKIPTLS